MDIQLQNGLNDLKRNKVGLIKEYVAIILSALALLTYLILDLKEWFEQFKKK